VSRPLLFAAVEDTGGLLPLLAVRRRADGRIAALCDPTRLCVERPGIEHSSTARAPPGRSNDVSAKPLGVPRLGTLLAPEHGRGVAALMDLAAHADVLPPPGQPPSERLLDVWFVGPEPTAALARELRSVWRAPGGGVYRLRTRRLVPLAGRVAVGIDWRAATPSVRAVGDVPPEALRLARLAAEAFGTAVGGPVFDWLGTARDSGGADVAGDRRQELWEGARTVLAGAFVHGAGGRKESDDGHVLELALARDPAGIAFDITHTASDGSSASLLAPLARFEAEQWSAPPRGPEFLEFSFDGPLGPRLERRVASAVYLLECARDPNGPQVDLDALGRDDGDSGEDRGATL